MSPRDGQCRCAWHGVTIWHVRRRVNVHLIDHADALMRRWLLLLVLGAVGCEKPPAPEASPREAASAPRDTSPKPALVPAAQAVDTTSARVSLTIPQACEAFAAIFTASAAANGIASSEVGVPRDTSMSFGETAPEQLEPGCRVAWSDTAKEAPLRDVLTRAGAAGWKERFGLLSADGPDGSVLAMSRGDVACLVSGQWDGGDDSDSTYVPAKGFEISASCFANRPDRY